MNRRPYCITMLLIMQCYSQKASLELVNRKWAFFGSEYPCYFFTIAVAMDILKVAMYSTPTCVPACVFLFNFNARIESYNSLNMAHRWVKRCVLHIL